MPALQLVERDYTAIADKLASIGPLADKLGFTVKNVTFRLEEQLARLAESGGVMLGGAADGRPAIDTDQKMAEAILTLSGTTNGELATQGFRTLERRVGKPLHDLAEGSEEKRITFAQTQQAPVAVITSPEWSGSETGGRRYAPFTVNVERLKPWHTLTGRMHFFLDHDWMRDLGEALPMYRPPLDMHRLFGEPELGPDGAKQVVVRYLTPHSKWSIHSEYQDNLFMLSLSRGGPTVWLSPADADAIGVAGQRLDGVPQRQRRAGGPGDRVAPDAGRRGLRASRPGAHHRRTEVREAPVGGAASTTPSPGCWSNRPT